MKRYIWLLCATLVVFPVWIAWFFQRSIMRSAGVYWWPETVGQWGDSFGALNALFAALAFLGVMGTLGMQRGQIQDAAKEQHLQRFDDTFFRLLLLLREARSEVRYTPSTVNNPRELTGPSALSAALKDAEHHLIAKRPVDRDLRATEVANIYSSNVHKRGEDGLGPYFRLAYTILRRIQEESLLSESRKIEYGNLLRGQLGSPEIGLLALNGLTKESKNLTDYILHFRMLKYLQNGVTKRIVQQHYPPEAFLGREE